MSVAVNPLLTPDISRPARYLGTELGSHHKPWEEAVVRWVLSYPEVYEVGASNLGHIILYNILNVQPRQLCDRSYLPGLDLSTKLRETDTPLFAVESRRALWEFDLIGFSLSYELGATNILEMLSLAHIPLTWQERMTGDRDLRLASDPMLPLVFAGGQTATSNPEPYADFFDFIVLGDGEELLPEIGLIVEEGKLAGLSRLDLLLDLAQIPGVYVPQFYGRGDDGGVYPLRTDVPRQILRRVATPIPHYSIGLVPYPQTVHDRLTVEIRRGCTRGCRFCQPGMLTRPARDVDPDAVITAIEDGMGATGHNEFSLLSLSCSDYLALPALGMEIKNRLKDANVSLSLPSQRVDRFDENIAKIIGGTRNTGITFAPEAGTQRLRDIINKGLTNEELLRGVKTAYEQGWTKIKLYFMIGLPGETDEDVLGIAETVRWLKQECGGIGRRPLGFNLTISNFTPKPHTPFQWYSVATSELTRKQQLLRHELRTIRGLKANFTDVRISAMEDFVGRGDRRLGSVIRHAWELGAREDSWWESLDRAFEAWSQAITAGGLTWKYRLVEQGNWLNSQEGYPADASQPFPNVSVPLPWDHLDTGIQKQWLVDDWHRALQSVTVPDCSFDGCSHCGVCGVEFGHNVVVPPPPIPEFMGNFTPPTNRVQRLRVSIGKLGEMRFISHLDWLRLLDRVVRRASIPIAFTGGYHPSPRIVPANALPLGVTSSGEIIDFELSCWVDPMKFLNLLREYLPADMPVFQVAEVDLKSPSATQLLIQAEYHLTVTTLEEGVDPPQWQTWINRILDSTHIVTSHKTKSGQIRTVNLRDRLNSLSLIPFPNPTIGEIHYLGSCRNDGTLLRPEHLIVMLEQVAHQPFRLLSSHRQQLILTDVLFENTIPIGVT